jgi:hypothetical protein
LASDSTIENLNLDMNFHILDVAIYIMEDFSYHDLLNNKYNLLFFRNIGPLKAIVTENEQNEIYKHLSTAFKFRQEGNMLKNTEHPFYSVKNLQPLTLDENLDLLSEVKKFVDQLR